MRLISASLLLVALAAAPSFLRADVTVTAIVSQTDMQADFDAGRYAQCLPKIAGLLTASPPPVGADRAKLMALKAECLLQDKQVIPAIDVFLAAASAYTDDKTVGSVPADNKKGAGIASATADLIRQSPGLQYTPKTGADKTPLPILDRFARRLAFTAMFNDELAVNQPTYKVLSTGKPTLDAILLFAPKLQALDAAEFAATGSETQCGPMQTSLATQAKTLMRSTIDQMSKTADQIATTAATPAQSNQNGQNGATGRAGSTGGRGRRGAAGQQQQQQQPQQPRGLTAANRSNLTSMETTIDKIPGAAKTLTTALATDPDYFKNEVTDALALKKKIDDILAGNFTPTAG